MSEQEVRRIRDQAASVPALMANELELEFEAGRFPGMDAGAVILILREAARLIREGKHWRMDA